MITTAMLDGLQDAELRTTIQQAESLLKQRDADRKAKAIEDARAMLAAAGLTLKDLNGKSRPKSAKGSAYRTGHHYQHPTNKELVWNAKGKKPNWLVQVEADGKKPLEVG
jgi:DNA-binding protein H-NS